MEHTEWLSRYHTSIKLCVERYQKMAEGHPDIIEFLEEFSDDVPLMKICRWVGYVQGILIERGVTTVEIERDWTRPLFRPLDFPNDLPTSEPSGFSDNLNDWSMR